MNSIRWMKMWKKTSQPNDNVEVVNLSQILEKLGKYQMLQYFYCCSSVLFVTLITINYVFVAGDVNYRCRIPSCEDPTPVYSPPWWPNTSVDRCYQPVLKDPLDSSTCTNQSFTNDVQKCSSWIYESNNTIVAELNLACQPWKVSLVGTVHNIGMMLAMPTSGWLADKYGRKPTTVICAVGGFLGLLKLVAASYYPYIFIELLEAAISGGVYTVTIVLMIEITGTKARIIPGVLLAYSVYLGEALYALIAMYIPYWKHLICIVCFPNIFFLSFIYIVKESPRWLIINGKIDEAKNALIDIAKTNKINVNIGNIEKANEETLKRMFKIDKHAKKVEFKDILRSREILKRIIVAFFAKFGTNFIYYGLLVNSVALPGDKYSNFLLAALVSFPGELIAMYLMNRIGRKKPLIFGFLSCGVFCLLCAVIPEEYTWLKLFAFLMAKLIVSACFTGLVTYAMELFPTSIRGSLCGFCTLASGFGSMLGPLTPLLTAIYTPLPFIFFCGCAMASGLLLILTPETKGKPLPDTLEQVNDSKKAGKTTGSDNFAYVDSETYDNNVKA